MDRIRRSDFARSFLLPLAPTFWLGACHKWVEVEPPDLALGQQAAKTAQDRDKLRLHIVESDGKVEGYLAELTQDSTILVTDDGRAGIPRVLIAQVDERRSDALGTVVLVLLPLGLVLLFANAMDDTF